MLPLPTGREASSGAGGAVYVRHRPERTLLYQLVGEYYPAFKAHLAAQGTALLLLLPLDCNSPACFGNALSPAGA